VSSGIQATLLEGCRTEHSALKLPLNLNRNSNMQYFPIQCNGKIVDAMQAHCLG